MGSFLVILIVLAAIATVVVLVRGVIAFLKAAEQDAKGGTGPSASSLKQNRMMVARIGFQALAVLLIAFLLLLYGGDR